MTARKVSLQIHLWLGLASGLVVCILGITGCMYVFEDEIKPLVYKDRMFVAVPANAASLPLSQLKEAAQLALGKDKPLQSFEVPSEPDRTVAFRAFKSNPEGNTYFSKVKYYHTVFINPYTAQVVKVENTKTEFFRLVVMFHWNLWIEKNDIGQQIVGWSVVMFVVLLITGLVLWWPRNKKAMKNSFFVKWDAKKKRLNYDLHNVFGFYAVTFGLMVSLTGLVWAFDWFSDSATFIANGGKAVAKPKPILSDTTQAAGALPLDKVYAQALAATPAAHSHFVSIPADKKAAIFVTARMGRHTHYKSIRLMYDQYNAKLLSTKGFDSMNGGEKMRSLNYDLHIGSILGLPGKILAFFASLICASLPVTGFIIWWGKKKKQKKGAAKKTSVAKTSYPKRTSLSTVNMAEDQSKNG